MKIAVVETISVKIPFSFGGAPTGYGGRNWTTNNILLVKVQTDDGLVGWGEAFCYGCTDAVRAALQSMIAPIDFERLWKLRRETLQKARYTWRDGRFQWDVDFFKGDDGVTYFALAEVEMPEGDTVPPPPPAILAPHVLLLAPRNDPRFTSKRLADRAHAERLLADVKAKGEAA